MLLHLVRHAHAVDADENPMRPLSARGRVEVTRLARFFLGNGCFVPAQIWHSPLARSRETVDELLKRLELDPVVVETPGLLPEDDPQELVERLRLHPTDRGDIALVGHEPHLSAFASLLVRDKASPALFRLKKGAVLTLEPTGRTHKTTGMARWRVLWQVSPELLPGATFPPSAAGSSALALIPILKKPSPFPPL